MRSMHRWWLTAALAVAPGTLVWMAGCAPSQGDADGGVTADGGEKSEGDGGPGGDTGDGGVSDDGRYCAQACTQDVDCEAGGFAFLKCIDDRCVSDPDAPPPADAACDTDAECVAFLSAWTLADSDGDFTPDAPCTAATDGEGACPSGEVCCASTQVCTQDGWCANPPFTPGSCGDFGPGFVETEVTDVDGNTATVCQKERADDAVCMNAGSPGAFCQDPCNIDDDCDQNPLGAVCNTTTGACGCSSDDECDHTENMQGYDVCQPNGTCGCSGDDVCPNAYDNSTGVCE